MSEHSEEIAADSATPSRRGFLQAGGLAALATILPLSAGADAIPQELYEAIKESVIQCMGQLAGSARGNPAVLTRFQIALSEAPEYQPLFEAGFRRCGLIGPHEPLTQAKLRLLELTARQVEANVRIKERMEAQRQHFWHVWKSDDVMHQSFDDYMGEAL